MYFKMLKKNCMYILQGCLESLLFDLQQNSRERDWNGYDSVNFPIFPPNTHVVLPPLKHILINIVATIEHYTLYCGNRYGSYLRICNMFFVFKYNKNKICTSHKSILFKLFTGRVVHSRFCFLRLFYALQ